MIRAIRPLATAAVLALGLIAPGRVAAADVRSTACVDSSSPSYLADIAIVKSLGAYGDRLTTFVFDGGQGVSERFFKFLSREKCGLIMGYPVDDVSPDPPDGLALTHSYMKTAYVLVAPRAVSLKTLRAGSTVAVGMATAPHFFLAGAFGPAPRVTADTFQSQELALDSLLGGRADSAMVWAPSLLRYEHSHAAARGWQVAPLAIPHGRWHMAALYDAKFGARAAFFNAALERLAKSGKLASIVGRYDLEDRS